LGFVSGLLGLPAKERRHVEIVRNGLVSNFANRFANGLLSLRLNGLMMDDIRRRLWGLSSDGLADFPASFPSSREEGRLFAGLRILIVRFLEAGGDHRNLHGVLHLIVHHRAENNVGVFVSGLLDDRRGFMYLMQGEA